MNADGSNRPIERERVGAGSGFFPLITLSLGFFSRQWYFHSKHASNEREIEV